MELARTMRTQALAEVEATPLSPPATASDVRSQRRFFTMLYDELRRMAQRELLRNAPATLSPTTLLHETYLSIARREALSFADGAHFMSYASRAMRGLMVDYLRNRHAQKRGGNFEIVPLQAELLPTQAENMEMEQIERLNEALETLAQLDQRLAECVDLKFFCGLSFNEIAKLRQVSERTVQRDWDKARLLLNRVISDRGGCWQPIV
jgi:RNA polymerase sigma factor (TIGR02999 family)